MRSTALFSFLTAILISVASADHYAITGTHTGSNAYRRNILDLQRDTVSWSLCVQALAALQAVSEDDPLSYFQICGIHGRPYTSWDNVPQAPNSPLWGYCAHYSILFPTWHRPYIALFEQLWAIQVQKIASQYPKSVRQTYQTAADQLRWPYWDWATNSQVPVFITTPTIRVTTPTGNKYVTNPFYSYKFQSPLDPDFFPRSDEYDGYLASDLQTVRDPDSVGAPSNITRANSDLASANLQQNTYYALTKSPSYDSFATTTVWGPSVEGVHNMVHEWVGGWYGHMSMLGYSAFDPIFWLHHCNIDRMTALYQAMNPTSYLTPFENPYGSYGISAGGPDMLNTSLTPFSTNTAGDFFTSETCQTLDTFGYSFPELPWGMPQDQLQKSATSAVNTLYGASSPSMKSRRDAAVSQITEWSVAISVLKPVLLRVRFLIQVFLGGVPRNPLDWSTSESLVGTFVVMPPPVGGTADVTVYNEFSLVNKLASKGLDGQDVDATVEYLKEYLHWRVQLFNGTAIQTKECRGLVVTVQEDIVIPGKDISKLPVYSDIIVHPEVTEGKPGGYTKR